MSTLGFRKGDTASLGYSDAAGAGWVNYSKNHIL